jgi:nicotinamide-nucleotide amidase
MVVSLMPAPYDAADPARREPSVTRGRFGKGIMFSYDIQALARRVVEEGAARGLTAACAESCTGGLVAGAITAVPGSSTVLDRGFVTYSNAAKTQMLGVPGAMIETHGAVSEAVARAMAEGALRRSGAGVSVAVTGIAGPGGGSAAAGPAGVIHVAHRFGDIGREGVRLESVRTALGLLLDRIGA